MDPQLAGNPLSTDPNSPLSKYFVYGKRNSFGLTYIRPGFNSGWQIIAGNTEDELVSFTGSHYTNPLLTWPDPIAVTDIEVLESSSLGE